MRVRVNRGQSGHTVGHRSPARARLYYSQEDVISILTRLDAMGLSKAELAGMDEWTLEEIDRFVNTVGGESRVMTNTEERTWLTKSELTLPHAEFHKLIRQSRISHGLRQWLCDWESWDLAQSPMEDSERRLIRYGHFLGYESRCGRADNL